jgi:hypothetical protein
MMEATNCQLGVGLVLGLAIGGLLIAGMNQLRTAQGKIKAWDAEKKKTGEAMKKAREKRSQGRNELLGAYLLILVSILILVFVILTASGVGIF